MLFPILLLITYAAAGAILWTRAMRFRADDRRPRAFDLFRPDLFRPEGQPARKAAVQFYVAGGIVAALAYGLFRFLQGG